MSDPAMDPRSPNGLFICCDHLRSDWLGCNGHPVVMTPQIDELAHQGISFRQVFSEVPVCVPARRVMMTGKGRYGVHMNVNKDLQPFPEGPKLAEVMTAAGYQTFASGKLHTCPQRNRIGFEDVQLNEEGRKQGGLLKDDYEAFLDEHGYLFDLQNDPHDLHDLSDDPAWQEVVAEQRQRLVAWLTQNDDPHAVDGALTAVPFDWDLDHAYAGSIWNNRGRH